MIQRLDFAGPWTDRPRLATRLFEAGLEKTAAWHRAELFGQAVDALEAADAAARGSRPAAFFVPGRIEVLGKHTDYAGGRSMVVATDRGFSLVCVPRTDRRVVVVDAARKDSIEFELHPDLVPTAGHWSNYPMTVARRIARNFPGATCGATIALASDLPPAAGMSSSSALMVAVFFGLAQANGLFEEPEFCENVRSLTDLAGYLGTIENGQTFGTLVGDRGVGTFGGSEDHTAMLCSRPGCVSQFAYCPVRLERTIRLPGDYAFAVAVSGVAAEKTGAAMERYNTASRLASDLVERWRRETGRNDPHLAAVLASRPDAADRLRKIIDPAGAAGPESSALLARLQHFMAENEEILPAAGDCLAKGDVLGFGRWVSRSQQAAVELLGNQIPETSLLASSARDCGAVAASAFGAGFGGSVWALVEKQRTDDFLASWRESYRARFPNRIRAASFFRTAAGPAAQQIA